MRLGPVRAWSPPPGRVLVVRPTTDLLARAAQAPVSASPPSFLQADHVAAYATNQAAGRSHRAWTGIASTIPEPFDPIAWSAAVATFLRRHEGHRSWFDIGQQGPAEPVRRVMPPEAIADTDFLVEELTEANGRAGESLHDLLDQVLGETCTPGSWPGFGLVVIDAGTEFSFMWGCDHAFTDAASQILLAGELAGQYERHLRPDADVAALPPTGGFGEYAVAERARAAAASREAPEVARWREIVAGHGGVLPTFPLDLGLAPGETAPVVIVEHEIASGSDLQDLESAVKSHGGRLPSAVAAACAVAELRLAGRERYFGITVLGTRDADEWARAQGWFCNFAPIDIDLRGHRTIATVLGAAEEAFAVARRLAQVPVHAALAAMIELGELDPASVGSPQLLSYLDLRWFPDVRGTGSARSAFERGHHFTAEGRTRNASSWFNRDAESLYVVCQVPDTTVARAASDRYYGEVIQILRLLAKAGDLAIEDPECG